MSSTQDLARLSPSERRRLLKFVVSFAWTDLEVSDEETSFVHRLIGRLRLTPDEASEVDQWLAAPPAPEEVDPTEIPAEHRALFLETVREMVLADGKASEEERETLALLEDLLR